jgi:hypothetical protein
MPTNVKERFRISLHPWRAPFAYSFLSINDVSVAPSGIYVLLMDSDWDRRLEMVLVHCAGELK